MFGPSFLIWFAIFIPLGVAMDNIAIGVALAFIFSAAFPRAFQKEPAPPADAAPKPPSADT